MFIQSGNIIPVADVDTLRISPTSQSLVILNTTERDLQGTYFCRAENGFGSLELRYSASITELCKLEHCSLSITSSFSSAPHMIGQCCYVKL